jgi:hypothetical protein
LIIYVGGWGSTKITIENHAAGAKISSGRLLTIPSGSEGDYKGSELPTSKLLKPTLSLHHKYLNESTYYDKSSIAHEPCGEDPTVELC